MVVPSHAGNRHRRRGGATRDSPRSGSNYADHVVRHRFAAANRRHPTETVHSGAGRSTTRAATHKSHSGARVSSGGIFGIEFLSDTKYGRIFPASPTVAGRSTTRAARTDSSPRTSGIADLRRTHTTRQKIFERMDSGDRHRARTRLRSPWLLRNIPYGAGRRGG